MLPLLILSSGLYLLAAAFCVYVIIKRSDRPWLLVVLILVAMWHSGVYGGMALGLIDVRTGGADYLRGLQPVWAALIIITAQYNRAYRSGGQAL